MGPSDKAFSQAKNILGKLDRTIDQLRQQRTQPQTVSIPTPPETPVRATVPTPPQQRPGQSGFGRATPLR